MKNKTTIYLTHYLWYYAKISVKSGVVGPFDPNVLPPAAIFFVFLIRSVLFNQKSSFNQ